MDSDEETVEVVVVVGLVVADDCLLLFLMLLVSAVNRCCCEVSCWLNLLIAERDCAAVSAVNLPLLLVIRIVECYLSVHLLLELMLLVSGGLES
jgi:hypothetical protein